MPFRFLGTFKKFRSCVLQVLAHWAWSNSYATFHFNWRGHILKIYHLHIRFQNGGNTNYLVYWNSQMSQTKVFFSLIRRQVQEWRTCWYEMSMWWVFSNLAKYSYVPYLATSIAQKVNSQHANAKQLVNYDRIDPQTPTSSVIIFL